MTHQQMSSHNLHGPRRGALATANVTTAGLTAVMILAMAVLAGQTLSSGHTAVLC
jgi:hypothetical protein